MALRRILFEELNVAASKKSGHALTMAVMRRTTPEGGLGLGVTAEEARRCPEEFYAVVFKNPERRAVVARGREGVGVGGVNGDNADDAEDGGERSTFTCDQEAVREFMSAPAARFHRAAHTYVVAGDAFDAGDFRVRICRVETNSGAYVGTILDVTYNATSDAATARRALEEYAAYATAAANARAESDEQRGDFVWVDLRSSCPADVYRAKAGDLQRAISYVDALRELRR